MTKTEELSRAACLELLERQSVGRVAVSTPRGPRIVPVNYTVHNQAIIFRTTPRSVVGRYAGDQEIAFEVDQLDAQDGAVSVLAWGRGHLVDDEDELRDIRRQHDPQPWVDGGRDTYLRLETQDLVGLKVAVPASARAAGGTKSAAVERVRLRDGTEAFIWPLLPSDREALRAHYDQLSHKSRHQRFMAAVPHLTDAMLDHLVDEVDGVNHVALVLIAFPDQDQDAPAGIARIVRYPDRPHEADVAVTVADAWQGRGVATVLLRALMRRRPRGITRIVTEVAADNPASLTMLERLGRTTTSPAGPGCLDVVVELPEPAAREGQDASPQ